MAKHSDSTIAGTSPALKVLDGGEGGDCYANPPKAKPDPLAEGRRISEAVVALRRLENGCPGLDEHMQRASGSLRDALELNQLRRRLRSKQLEEVGG